MPASFSRRRTVSRFGVTFLLTAIGSAPLLSLPARSQAQVPPPAATIPVSDKHPITHDVYDRWRSIMGTDLSRDGKWVVYTLQPQDGDGILVARSTTGSKEIRVPRGTGAQITADCKFVVFTIAPTKAERDKAHKEKKTGPDAPKSGLGILNLATGQTVIIDQVKRWSIAEDGFQSVAYLLEAPARRPATGAIAEKQEEKKDAEVEEPGDLQPPRRAGSSPTTTPTGAAANRRDTGTDLVFYNLADGTRTVTPDVLDFQWNKPGTRLAYVVAGKDTAKDGVSVVEMDGKASSIVVVPGTATVKNLIWDDKGEQFAFLRQSAPPQKPADKPAVNPAEATTPTTSPAAANSPATPVSPPLPPTTAEAKPAEADKPALPYTLYLWHTGQPAAREIVTGATPNIIKSFSVSENAAPRFSREGERITLGLAPTPKPARSRDASEPINVDIWSTTDPYLQTMQKVRADEEKKRSYAAVYYIKDRKLVPLAGPDMPTASVDSDAKRFALGSSDLPYRVLMTWDQSYRDTYLVDLKTASRRTIRVKHSGSMSISPAEKYVLYWDEGSQAWWSHPTEKDRPTVNLTAKLKVNFADEENDVPGSPAPYGVAGWTEGDRTVLLYDRYDIWEVRPDTGEARMITQGTGRTTRTQFRYQSLNTDERTIPTKTALLLTATDDRTKATGLYRLASLSETDAQPQRLVMLEKAMGPVRKAKNADTLIFTLSRFEEFPNLWTASLATPEQMTRLSDANPQQAEYRWGTSELIEYRNADGKILRARLIKPEGFDPGKKYPLLVNIYETQTENQFRYTAPAPGTSINLARYVSNGYVLLLPDITYTVGYPGESALKCVVPAIETVVTKGYIDPARIGIQGHSWGAYQITYLVTRTNLFRAAEAGAAVADMFSAYGGIRWETGMSRQFQYERTQSRIGATPWQAPLRYLENSPLFWVDKVQTPYLTIHNDADGAVPWYQGIEFFTAMRRLGKEAYLFNYNGEDHNLRNRENMKHWTLHMAEFFDHYLLGAPRPDWMKTGVGYEERGQRDLNPYYNPAQTKAGASESEVTLPVAQGTK